MEKVPDHNAERVQHFETVQTEIFFPHFFYFNSLLKLLGGSWLGLVFFSTGFAILVAIFQYSCSKSAELQPLSLLSRENVQCSRPPR